MIKRLFIVALMLFTAVEVNSEELDESLIQSSTNPVVLQQGKVLFEQVLCVLSQQRFERRKWI
ncbi:hypothetical protein P4S68_09675 [Pseudoalteromonas sp. Hal099]